MSSGPDGVAAAPIAPPRTRVLALVADLSADLAAVDLDTIDGEFYWRCGRDDLLEQIAALYGSFPILHTPPPTWIPDDVFRYIGHGFAHAQQMTFLEIGARMLYPRVIWQRLTAGERVAMRLPEVIPTTSYTSDDDDADRVRTLRIRVFSGAWTGVDVEQAVVQACSEHRLDDAPQEPIAPTTPVASSVHLDFAFIPIPTPAPVDPVVRALNIYPRVEITAPLPLPPPGAIGREYDAVVREFYKWHLRLPGATTSRQDKEVALRTWGVGLLVASGARFVDAMREVCEVGGLPEVSQTRFGQDRQRLVARVPEADSIVYARD